MIPVEIYTNVYYLLLSVTILLSILPLFVKKDLESFPKVNLHVGLILLLSIVVLFIGLRDPFGSWRYLGDTNHYTDIFYNYIEDATYGIKSDYGFYLLMLFSKEYLNIQLFYLLCAFIYVLPVFLISKKWFKEYAFFSIILFISSMSFWSFGINGVRNGLATSLFLLGFYFYEKKWLMFVFVLLSITFHKSMILPTLALLISYGVGNTKMLIKIWVFIVVFSFFVGSQVEILIGDYLQLSGIMGDKRLDTYFSDELDGELVDRRYRLDFIIYSAIPIFLGYYYKYIKGFNDKFYNQVFNLYILSNSIWVIFIYAAYTNRIAYLSWFIMPLILVYPILKKQNLVKNENLYLGILILSSLFFTLLIHLKT